MRLHFYFLHKFKYKRVMNELLLKRSKLIMKKRKELYEKRHQSNYSFFKWLSFGMSYGIVKNIL